MASKDIKMECKQQPPTELIDTLIERHKLEKELNDLNEKYESSAPCEAFTREQAKIIEDAAEEINKVTQKQQEAIELLGLKFPEVGEATRLFLRQATELSRKLALLPDMKELQSKLESTWDVFGPDRILKGDITVVRVQNNAVGTITQKRLTDLTKKNIVPKPVVDRIIEELKKQNTKVTFKVEEQTERQAAHKASKRARILKCE